MEGKDNIVWFDVAFFMLQPYFFRQPYLNHAVNKEAEIEANDFCEISSGALVRLIILSVSFH